MAGKLRCWKPKGRNLQCYVYKGASGKKKCPGGEKVCKAKKVIQKAGPKVKKAVKAILEAPRRSARLAMKKK